MQLSSTLNFKSKATTKQMQLYLEVTKTEPVFERK